ncbi:nitroreductase family protein [Candidatus Cryosericum septentrionale]|jgi:nitroreductase|uniref:Nitroreductase family protein n=1 Tax=Candidatus Cryosericum septentrionale TaxID=2290913 RepID=A0A398DRS3_9BACT|nr:nitroreductase family protein [Candidatus Cryosericum septentrionale]RIE16873.1 nitroreductase family protein [Candidatus Cryosericum septentrionale]
MDIWTAIKNRRSIRKFTDDPVEDKVLKNLVLEAGIWSPSGGNAQSWRFLVITDPKILNKLKLVSPGLLGTPNSVIVICQDLAYALKKGGELGVKILSLMDTAMAAQNIMLAAYAVGLGTCPIASFHPEAVQKITGLPVHIYPQLLISVGFPGENPPAPRRNPNVIWFNSYADE